MKKSNGVIDDQAKINHSKPAEKKILCGLIVFIVSLLMPLFIPLIIQLNISSSSKAIISAFMLFGVPELGMILAAIILGKEGFSYMKSQVFSWVKKTVIATTVGPTRYRIGIILFSVTLIIGFFIPYATYFFSLTVKKNHYYYIFTLDFLFFISLFILGGNFWEKLRALFIYDMIATRTTITD